jgi:uncharacterized protein with HEPN domain
MSRDIVTLADIYIALVRIREFVAAMTRDSFLVDRKTQSAVLHQMMIIGEAAKRLSAEFLQAHPEVNWKELAGLRDVLIHQYDDVNLQWVWDMIVAEFPELLPRVAQILPYPPI